MSEVSSLDVKLAERQAAKARRRLAQARRIHEGLARGVMTDGERVAIHDMAKTYAAAEEVRLRGAEYALALARLEAAQDNHNGGVK